MENREIGVSPIRAQRCKGDCLILACHDSLQLVTPQARHWLYLTNREGD